MNKKHQARRYIVSDYVAAFVAWLLFNWLRYEELAVYEGFTSLKNYLMHYQAWKGQLLIPLFWLILYYFSGYYNKPFGKSRLTEFFSTFITVTIGSIFIFFVVVLNDLPRSYEIYYELFFAMWGLHFVLTYIPRLMITQDSIKRIKRREWTLKVLLIGTGEKARSLADNLYSLGYEIIGFVRDESEKEVKVDESRIIGSSEDIPSIIGMSQVDEIVLALDSKNEQHLLSLLYSLYEYKCPIKISADNSNILSRVNIKTIHGTPLIDLTDNNFSEAEKNIKWVLDKLISLVVLILLSPMYLYIAWRIKKESSGPVFFKQERIGYMGEPFTIYKFRTMYMNAEKDGPLLTIENDSRVTPFGHIMRKYRLDEFPQFWNVLKGDMSLVGPRPERKHFIDQIVKKAPYYYLLHNVRPGITSLGMVKYGYAANVKQMIERLQYDILYYENMSLVLDMTILIYTVKTVITGKGV